MIVGIVSGHAESAFVNDWMDRDKKMNSPVIKNTFSLAFLLSSSFHLRMVDCL